MNASQTLPSQLESDWSSCGLQTVRFTFVASVVVEAGVVEDVAGAVEEVAGALEEVVGAVDEEDPPPQPARTVAAIAAVMTKAIVLFFITFPFFE